MRHETLANLSGLPDQTVEAIEAALKGTALVPAAQAVRITRSVPHGHVAAVHAMAVKLGLPALLGPAGPDRDLALALVISRVVAPEVATGNTLHNVHYRRTCETSKTRPGRCITQGVHVRPILVDPCVYLINSAGGPVARDEDIDVGRRTLKQPQRGEVVLDRVRGTALLWQNSLWWASTPSATCLSTGGSFRLWLQPPVETVVPGGSRSPTGSPRAAAIALAG